MLGLKFRRNLSISGGKPGKAKLPDRLLGKGYWGSEFRRAPILDGTSQEDFYFCAEACLALEHLEGAQMKSIKAVYYPNPGVFSEKLINQQGKLVVEAAEKFSRYEKLTKDALQCMLEIKDMKEAHRNYKAALDVVQTSTLVKNTSKQEVALKIVCGISAVAPDSPSVRKIDKTEVTVLRYACGITAVVQDSPEMLQDAHQIFVGMHEDGLSNGFPLIFYGLSSVLVAQKRFQEALKYLEAGLNLSRKMRKKWKPVSWPNSEQVIEESQLETYQKLMENLLRKCRPLPVTDTTPSDLKESSKNKIEKYQALTAEAMEALHHANHLRAFEKFQAAYDLVSIHQSLKETMSIIDILTLRYACGITAVSQDSLKPLQEGLDIFEAMLKEGLGNTFPLTYYGLGKAFIALYRFGTALKYIDAGMSFPRKIKNLGPICWPSSEEIIEESRPDVYQQQMEAMLKNCRYPPIPDAVCSVHISEREKEAAIYFSDPSFSGVIWLECYLHCRIAFHRNCWQDFKIQVMERTLDKDVLNYQCPTPDCGSVVRTILIIRPGHKNKEFISATKPPKDPAPRRKVLKIPKSNQEKIARQAERKERRQRKRQEARAVDADRDVAESKDKDASLFEKNNEMKAVANPAAMTVLRKEDENYVKYQGIQKQVKHKKKKDKVKQVLNVEVNFTKDKSLLLGEQMLDDDTQSGTGAGTSRSPDALNQEVFARRKPGTPSLAQLVAKGSKSYSIQNDEAITQNLYEYFGEILKASGPLRLSDPLLHQELSCLPPEAVHVIQKAGGLPRFFLQSLKFVVIDEIVANITDARRAHELARGFKPSVMLSPQRCRPLLPNSDIKWLSPQALTLMEATSRPLLVNGVLPSSNTSAQLYCRPNALVKHTNSEMASHVKKSSFNGIHSNNGKMVHTVETSSQSVPLKLSNQSRAYRLGATYSSVSNGSSYEDDGSRKSVEKFVSSTQSKAPFLSGLLNPSAPEFKPGQNSDVTVGKAINSSRLDVVKHSTPPLLKYSTGSGARPKPSSSYSHLNDFFLDKSPKTDYGSIDNFDFILSIAKDMKNDSNDVDNSSVMPVTHWARSGSFRGPSQLTPEPGSTSDLSETSDMSVGNLFHTSSPGSSISSFRVTGTHDSVSYTVQDLPSLAAEAAAPHKSVSPVTTLLHERELSQASVNSSALSDWNTGSWGQSLHSDLSEKVQMGESASTPPPQTYMTSGFDVLEESKPTEAASSDRWDTEASANSFLGKRSAGTDYLFRPPDMVQALLEDKDRRPVMLEHCKEKNRLNSNQAEALQLAKNKVLMQSEVTIQKLSAEHSRKEQQIEDIINYLVSKSTQMGSECKWLKQHLQAVEEEMQSEKSRAREAEIETVKTRQQVALMHLELKRKEVEQHYHCVSRCSLECEKRGEVPLKIKEALKYWENLLNAFAFKEAQIKRDFEAMMTHVKAGKRLSELPLVSITPPPVPKLPQGAPVLPANGQLPFVSYQMDQHQLRSSPSPSPPVRAQYPAMVNTASVPHAKGGAPGKMQNINSALHHSGSRVPRPLVPPKGLASMPLTPAAPRLPIFQPPAPVVTQASFAAAVVRPVLRPTLSLPKPPSPLTMVTTSQPHRPQQPNPSVPAVSRAVVGAAGNPGKDGVTIGHARILSSEQTAKQTSLDKLMNVLQIKFPSCTRDNFTQLTQELRRAHGGSLSGMSLEVILTRLTQMAIARGFKLCSNGETRQVQAMKQSTDSTESRNTTGPPPGIQPSWSTEWVQHLRRQRQPDCASVGGGDNFEEGDPCAICHEELFSALITTLDCHHKFHNECIQRWFKEQPTCPNCRVHFLLQDDLPSLK